MIISQVRIIYLENAGNLRLTAFVFCARLFTFCLCCCRSIFFSFFFKESLLGVDVCFYYLYDALMFVCRCVSVINEEVISVTPGLPAMMNGAKLS